MVSPAVRKNIKRYLKRLGAKGLRVDFGIIFGSYAQGNATPISDIDLIVVSSKYDKQYKADDENLLWRVAAKTDSRIEPIPCGKREWQDGSDNPIIEIAKKAGEKIAA
jgi:predicted nucleotidyltransferase